MVGGCYLLLCYCCPCCCCCCLCFTGTNNSELIFIGEDLQGKSEVADCCDTWVAKRRPSRNKSIVKQMGGVAILILTRHAAALDGAFS